MKFRWITENNKEIAGKVEPLMNNFFINNNTIVYNINMNRDGKSGENGKNGDYANNCDADADDHVKPISKTFQADRRVINRMVLTDTLLALSLIMLSK